ncbi:MAG: recombination mediator RecR [Neomegalonema sp.]|nr:recombination mediator RecR [Neomegalonema sp.]
MTAGGPSEIEMLIRLLSKLPGLGPRSARRAALHLVRRPEERLAPLAQAMAEVALKARACKICGNIDVTDICAVCADEARDGSILCVVEEVGDLWAMERAGVFRGRYHVLGGVLSALDGVGPDELRVPELIRRASAPEVAEVVLALGSTVDGQTTAHVIADSLADANVRLTALARGLPLGGELGHLDEGTIHAAFGARRGL